MTVQELIKKIENGSDILFDVMGRHFTILTWCDEGISIGEQAPYGKDLSYYKSAEDLVNRFLVGGKTLADLADKVVITDYT